MIPGTNVDAKLKQGPTLEFDCWNCGAKDVEGSIMRLSETVNVLYQELKQVSSTLIRCKACKAEFTGDVTIRQIEQLDDKELADAFRNRIPLSGKITVIASFALIWVPMMGLILAILAVSRNRNVRDWPKYYSVFSLILNVPICIYMLYLLYGIYFAN
jgi:hypothetical protein